MNNAHIAAARHAAVSWAAQEINISNILINIEASSTNHRSNGDFHMSQRELYALILVGIGYFIFHMSWPYASSQIRNILDQGQCSSGHNIGISSGPKELFFCNRVWMAMIACLQYQGFAKLTANFIHAWPFPPLVFNASHRNLCHFPHSWIIVITTDAME
jgi:hypothetical protein